MADDYKSGEGPTRSAAAGGAEGIDKLRGGLGRVWSTASLTSKLGMKAASRVLFRGKTADPEAALASRAAAIASAKQLVARMGQLKGLVMKAGQIASYMPGALPPEAQEVLAELQSASTPMTFERIDEVVRSELGAPARELFDEFEPRPFAAASIGQVHRARWRGQALAVKVQYPGIEDAIRSDLRTVGALARLSMIGSPVSGGDLVRELRDRLLEECDYEREARNQREFATLLAAMTGASVPAVIAERSSRRVLTSELVSSMPLPAFATTGDQAARDRAGELVFRASFELLFRRCIYNADPHPGNYLVTPAGDVTFLDFGCVRRFEPAMIAVWKQMASAVLAGDRDGFAAAFRTLGFVGKERGFDWDYQWNALRSLYRPFLEPGFGFTPSFVTESFSVQMFDNPNRMKLAMPAEWLFLNRLQWGLFAVLAQLGARAPWGDIFREQLAAPIDPA